MTDPIDRSSRNAFATFSDGYVTVRRLAVEGAIGTITYGGTLYAVHISLNRQ